MSDRASTVGTGGGATLAGAVAAMDRSMSVELIASLPLATTVESGRILTNNPVWLTLVDEEVLLHAVPDDDVGSLLTYRLRRTEG